MSVDNILIETPFLERLLSIETDRVVDLDRGRLVVRDSVVRNLRWLFNSHPRENMLSNPQELHLGSVLRFGVPDFSSSTLDSEFFSKLPSVLRSIVTTYEPRLAQVGVGIVAMTSDLVLIRIDAVLLLQLLSFRTEFVVDVRLVNGEVGVD